MAEDRPEAFVLVTEGRVFVDGQKAVSPAQPVKESARIEVRAERRYVGRGGEKLEAAIRAFAVDVADKVAADVGAAIGGFTQVLLKHGVRKVYAIDVGRGKLDLKLREDPGVVIMEGVDVRALGKILLKSDFNRRLASPALPEQVDIVTIDVSFISLRQVLPIIRRWLAEESKVIALFKPQYEVGDKSLLKHGILRDEKVRDNLVEEFHSWLNENGWQELGFMESPIRGAEGNVEYFFYLKPGTL